ncbi:MAG: hypothetical protein IPH75_14675 [bacterium]|nr:hypothetical protein [bacterium]
MTIIEVLVAAAVFMIGFSLLIALVSNSTAKFSTRELTLGRYLAQQTVTLSQARLDTLSGDTTVQMSGLQFSVARRIELDGRLAKVHVTVTRTKTGSLLADFYGEYALSYKP